MSYLVHLKQFEGPLGLLLYLIRKEEMDIFDINVTEITRQYLDYIRLMKELDLEVAGEFVAMAATLIHIKSKMLLPHYNDEGDVVEQEDPRKELVQKLLDYQKYQEGAKLLYDRPLLNRDVYSRGLRENFVTDELGEVVTEEDGLFSLISAYRKMVRKAQKAVHKVRPRVQSIASRIMELKDRLLVGSKVLLRDLVGVGGEPHRGRLLITFLSMLELGRMGFISLFQNETYGDIYIEPKKAIERNVMERVQEFDSADAEDVVNHIIHDAEDEKALRMEENLNMESISDSSGEQSDLLVGDEMLTERESEVELSSGEMASDDEILAAEMEMDQV